MRDEEWTVLEPLIEEVRPHAKVPIASLRQRIEGIFWRHENGAKWRATPVEFGPWWKPAQTFVDWAGLGVWERLLELARERFGATRSAWRSWTAAACAPAQRGAVAKRGGNCGATGR